MKIGILFQVLPHLGFRFVGGCKETPGYRRPRCAFALKSLNSREIVGSFGRVGMVIAQNAPSRIQRFLIYLFRLRITLLAL